MMYKYIYIICVCVHVLLSMSYLWVIYSLTYFQKGVNDSHWNSALQVAVSESATLNAEEDLSSGISYVPNIEGTARLHVTFQGLLTIMLHINPTSSLPEVFQTIQEHATQNKVNKADRTSEHNHCSKQICPFCLLQGLDFWMWGDRSFREHLRCRFSKKVYSRFQALPSKQNLNNMLTAVPSFRCS